MRVWDIKNKFVEYNGTLTVDVIQGLYVGVSLISLPSGDEMYQFKFNSPEAVLNVPVKSTIGADLANNLKLGKSYLFRLFNSGNLRIQIGEIQKANIDRSGTFDEYCERSKQNLLNQ